MFSNITRIATAMLLASAASPVFAAPAPVSDLSEAALPVSTAVASVASSVPESDVQRLERLLQNRNRVQLQMQQQIDQMSLEISELRGELERNSYEMKQMLERQRELFVELDRVRGEVKSAASTPAASVSEPSEQASTETGTFSSNVDEQQAYQNAVDLILKKRDYTGAITAFKQFQTNFPDSTYSANAHYWLGQLYFAKKQDKDAVSSFAAVVAYPESNKRADALLKLGDIAARNNNAAQAQKYYQQVVAEYPGSASANLAQSKLAQ
ncbi:tol-pal system protein YbgF [Vibrio sp. SM6]|uniref:Cell division coordinator CpoB n=1 Tax=Vibrio agarilyticus TaxID=2726741 RepID=A0A7X8YFF9_9VIBR|nr:tol-pal system protein YbgF [Vibrio agarilyticus]NLS11272.1 tol-pal system protein YbgF [Vibrio agarilyticus]